MERSSVPQEFEVAMGGAIAAPEAFGASFEELPCEIEVLDPGGGRIADITAGGSVRCLALSRGSLLTALEADPRAAIALIGVLAARFRGTA